MAVNYTDPNDFTGSDIEKINAAIQAAAACGCGKTIITSRRADAVSERNFWLVDSAVLLPDNLSLIIRDTKIKLSNACRDNMIRSANTLIDTVPDCSNISIIGEGKAILEGADIPRATGDAVKVLGERTFGSDAGKAGETATGDWRNIGILLVKTHNFTLKNLHIKNSHGWAISLEYCTDGKIADLSFDSCGKIEINGENQVVLNQDGLDLRRGCRNIEIENITGTTGDDLVALTAIPTGKRPAGRWGEHEFMGDSTDLADEDVYNISIKTVCGYSAGRCNIVRFLNTRGIKMYDIILDGVKDTSTADKRNQATVRIGEARIEWGGVTPLNDARNFIIKNIDSYSRTAVLIAGSLAESSIINLVNHNPENPAIVYKSGIENTRELTLKNITDLPNE